ncbi:MAG: LysR substrate-binding domain-containing protein [Pseudomonadota bacterium]|nr:LysR substrate-binding domain-containing protein [Pseudomonadota bacterium]
MKTSRPAVGTPIVPLTRIRSRLRLRHLVFIESLALHGNIRQAARDLCITQPAASKLLQEIEATFEVRLYDRNAHGIVSTPSGDVLLHWAHRALADMDAAERELAALHEGWEGRVRIGIFPVAAPMLVPDAIARMRESGSRIHISIQEGLEDRLIPLLELGTIDCVVGRMTLHPDARAIATEALFEEPTVVVCAPGHSLLGGTTWGAAALNRPDWILPSTSAPLYSLVTAALAKWSGDPPRVAVETSSILTLVEILSRTDMLSAIPHGVAERFVRTGQLAILPLRLAQGLHPVGIMTARDHAPNPATLAFLAAVRQSAQMRRPTAE